MTGVARDLGEPKNYSIERRPCAPQLEAGAVLLGLDAALAGGLGRLGRPPQSRRDRGTANEIDEAIKRVLTVAALGAVTLRGDDQHAIARQAGAGQSFEPIAHLGRQRRR